MRLLTALFLFASTLAAQDSLPPPLLERWITQEQALADLEALEDWMIAVHPAGLTSDTLLVQGALRRASNQLRYGASTWVFARIVGEAMAAWGDSHTGLAWRELLPEMESTWGRFPGEVSLESGGITVVNSPNIPAGTSLDSVGGWSARAILENARGLVASEAFARQPQYRRAERLWPWMAAVPPPGMEATRTVTAVGGGNRWEVDLSPEKSHPQRRDSGVRVAVHPQAVVIRVESFNRGGDDRFRRHVRRAFRRIRRLHPQGVVIDLRGNAGGLASRMECLAAGFLSGPDAVLGQIQFRATPFAQAAFSPDFAEATLKQRSKWARNDRWAAWRLEVDGLSDGMLWSGRLQALQPARKAFAGPVAVVVDGGTASTAAHFALWAANQSRMRTFGEPALTGTSGTGAHSATWHLPHSELPVQCSTMRIWVNADSPDWNVGQWMPDAVVPRQMALQAALEWIVAP